MVRKFPLMFNVMSLSLFVLSMNDMPHSMDFVMLPLFFYVCLSEPMVHYQPPWSSMRGSGYKEPVEPLLQ